MATGIAQIHAHLTVRDLADRATILRGDAYRRGPLLDDAGLVNDHHPIRIAHGIGDQELLACDDRFNRPRTLANEVLEVTHIAPLGQGDAFNRLAGLLADQAVEIHIGRGGLLGAAKGGDKVGVKGGAGVHELRNLAGGEVADGWWGGGWYNSGRHGDPPRPDVVMRPGGYHAVHGVGSYHLSAARHPRVGHSIPTELCAVILILPKRISPFLKASLVL